MDHGDHRPRKRFGQNFLTDQRVIADILRAVHARPGETIAEIGPGRGALTEGLIASGATLHLIEIDRDLVPILREQSVAHGQLTIVEADVLTDRGSLGSACASAVRP